MLTKRMLLMALVCSGTAVAEHGGTKEFERRSREAREATNGKVKYERLKAFWDEGAVYFKNEDGEGCASAPASAGACSVSVSVSVSDSTNFSLPFGVTEL